MSRKTYTTEQVAEMYATDAWKVRELIRTGQLGAIDIRTKGIRPHYRITDDHLAAFEAARSTRAPAAGAA